MLHLVVVSIIWAASFGLIKHQLAGVDAAFVSLVRLSISGLLFLPFLRLTGITRRVIWQLMTIGAVQYGLMYLAYIQSFTYLASYQVALFTVFTPLFVAIVNDGLERRWHGRHWLAAGLAVIGSAVVVYREAGVLAALGILLVQISNLCFAAGQILYARVMSGHPRLPDRSIFSLLYAGGMIVCALFWIEQGMPCPALRPAQWITLLYLGLVASGIAFFLWNVGARRVSPGTLAVMNNAKIPLGIFASLLIFGESTSILRLLAGGVILVVALWMNRDSGTVS